MKVRESRHSSHSARLPFDLNSAAEQALESLLQTPHLMDRKLIGPAAGILSVARPTFAGCDSRHTSKTCFPVLGPTH